MRKVQLSKAEDAPFETVAKMYGMSADDVFDLATKAALARRVKKRTGKSPARVYPMGKRKK